MLKKDLADQSLPDLTPQSPGTRAVEIAGALPMSLHLLDLARHTVIAPDGNRYVVASFDDTRLERGYLTVVYPQQNGYLTLVRLIISQFSSSTPDGAIKRHITVAQAIQQGRLKDLNRSA